MTRRSACERADDGHRQLVFPVSDQPSRAGHLDKRLALHAGFHDALRRAVSGWQIAQFWRILRDKPSAFEFLCSVPRLGQFRREFSPATRRRGVLAPALQAFHDFTRRTPIAADEPRSAWPAESPPDGRRQAQTPMHDQTQIRSSLCRNGLRHRLNIASPSVSTEGKRREISSQVRAMARGKSRQGK